MFARFQGRRICPQFEIKERERKGGRLELSAGEFDGGITRLEIRGRKNNQGSGRGGEHEGWLARDFHVIRIRIGTEAFPQKFEAIRKRGFAGNGRNFDRRGRGLCGGENNDGNAAGAALDGTENHAGIEWSNKERAAGCVSFCMVSVGKVYGNVGSQSSVGIQDGKSRPLSRNNAAGKKKRAG